MSDRKPLHLRDIADPRKALEKAVYEWCVSLYRSVGVDVVRHSQPYKAAQTCGIWDIECYYRERVDVHPDDILAQMWLDAEGNWWRIYHWGHEVKRYQKLVSPGQEAFHRNMALFGVPSLVGGLNTAIKYLNENGIAHFEERPDHW